MCKTVQLLIFIYNSKLVMIQYKLYKFYYNFLILLNTSKFSLFVKKVRISIWNDDNSTMKLMKQNFQLCFFKYHSFIQLSQTSHYML